MKNKKITEAWDKIIPNIENLETEETKIRVLNKTRQKLHSKKESFFKVIFKPARIIAAAAAVLLTVGLINIQTVIGAINDAAETVVGAITVSDAAEVMSGTVTNTLSRIFFVPGFGLVETDDFIVNDDGTVSVSARNIIIDNYGIEAPITIVESGSLTMSLIFVNRITRNSESELHLHFLAFDAGKGMPPFDPQDMTEEELIADFQSRELYMAGIFPQGSSSYISAEINGETVVFDLQFNGSSSSGGGDYSIIRAEALYVSNIPPGINEFYLHMHGIKTPVVLTEQHRNFALSQENNGITLAAFKPVGVPDMIFTGVSDSAENAADYIIMSFGRNEKYGVAEDGERIELTGGSGTANPSYIYSTIRFRGNERDIKQIKSDNGWIGLRYGKNPELPPLTVTIPVPKDGETIETNIEAAFGSHIYRITQVRREGDVIYYESNSRSDRLWGSRTEDDDAVSLFLFFARGLGFGRNSSRYISALENRESHFQIVYFNQSAADFSRNIDDSAPQIGGGRIWNFGEASESVTFYIHSAHIIQFGNFDIEFD
jgi:hypothetical protein